jgi:hypothetical protein
MKTLIARAVILLFVCAAVVKAADIASLGQATVGTITYQGRKMILKSAYAVSDAKQSTIAVELFPFDLSAGDVQKMQKHFVLSVVMSKPSPDPSMWKYAPHAKIRLRFAKGSSSFTKAGIDSYTLFLNGMMEQGRTDSYSIMNPDAATDISGFSIDGDELTLVVKRVDTNGGTKGVDYQFQVKTRLYPQ